jgi:hypothetical protein
MALTILSVASPLASSRGFPGAIRVVARLRAVEAGSHLLSDAEDSRRERSGRLEQLHVEPDNFRALYFHDARVS